MAMKRKVVPVGSARITPVTSKERKEIAKQIKKEREQLRKVYPGESTAKKTHDGR